MGLTGEYSHVKPKYEHRSHCGLCREHLTFRLPGAEVSRLGLENRGGAEVVVETPLYLTARVTSPMSGLVYCQSFKIHHVSSSRSTPISGLIPR